MQQQAPPTISAPDFALLADDLHDLPCHPEPFLAINRIPIRDNGEHLVDLRQCRPELLLSEHCVPYVREQVSTMLASAADQLPTNIRLQVSTAMRTLQTQSEMYWKNYELLKTEHPTWPSCTLRRMCNRFFAPPDTKAPPGHCTGGAVDVRLIDAEGEPLDVSSPLEGWSAAPTAVHGLTDVARENRRLLCSVMHHAGFSNCRDEHWHWSYGDSAWVVRAGASIAIYGFIEPPQDSIKCDDASSVTAQTTAQSPTL